VEVTRQILKAHGVCKAKRVVVCHPFDPWAIGGVFRDAALACGAKVLPLGLSSLDQSLREVLVAFDPIVLCGSASLLIRLGQSLRHDGLRVTNHQRVVFHAGEPLTLSARVACRDLWNSKVINVYGSAEFDSIASEGRTRQGLILSPHLKSALSFGVRCKPLPLKPGLEGELLLRLTGQTNWRRTRDRVRVLDRSREEDGLWLNSWRFEHLGRTDTSLQLPDGSLVRESSILALAQRLPIGQVQVHSFRTHTSAKLRVLVTSDGAPTVLNGNMVRRAILHESFELGDAVKHGVAKLSVSIVDNSKLERTRRGKVVTFVEH
jgi:phenylacetate-coenzyme A ligase PaaK-like adenylate-forming protein